MQEEIIIRAGDTLLNKGVAFEIESRGLLRLFKKTTKWTVKPSMLGTLFEVSRIYLRHSLNTSEIETNAMGESNRAVVESHKQYSIACAIAVLNSKWKIRLFKRVLGNYFFWHIDSNTMLKIMTLVIEQNNVLDFMHTIRLTSGIAKILEKTERPEENLSPGEHGG